MRIADYGFLSDCQSAALVSMDGSIDWWCPPRFDAPSVFGRLLGAEAGYWSIHPAEAYESTRRYEDQSLVLTTIFKTETGSAAVTDALILEEGARAHEIGKRSPGILVRRVRCLEGEVRMRTEYSPRFEYGLTVPSLVRQEQGLVARGGPATLYLNSDVNFEKSDDDKAVADFTLSAGQTADFNLAFIPSFSDEEPPRIDAKAALADTAEAWRSWTAEHTGYDGRYLDIVRLSSLVLQGLTYEPTGAIIAAPTTSLPEKIGADLNWDYRFAWLRDVSLTMRAQWVAACPHEAYRFFDWVASAGGRFTRKPLQIMYGLEGERDLTEHTLDHLEGFQDSHPVRIGNDAWKQRQVDVLGEVMDAAHLLKDQLGDFGEETRKLLVGIADRAAQDWREPDAGIWEARDRERHYLSSKLFCWVALDRAVKLLPALGEEGAAREEDWSRARNEVREAILTRGWSEKSQAYAGAFESDNLDASVLLMPIVEFLPADDPRMRATIEAIERELSVSGLVFRWKGDTSYFLICSYWLVECIALLGDLDKARQNFEHITSFGNDLGLLAEEVDPETGELLGNYPQAFSHVGLVNAAWRITELAAGAEGQAA